MRMRIRFRVCQIMTNGTADGIVYVFNGTSANWDQCIPLTFVNSYYYPSYIVSLARLFDYFYVNNCDLTFEPRRNTSSDITFTQCFVQDPSWVTAHGAYDGNGQAAATELQITSFSNACTSVAYAPCYVKAVCKPSARYYSAANDLTTVLAWNESSRAALYRETIAGCFLMKGDIGATTTANMVVGDMYMSLDFELCEFTTAITTVVTEGGPREEKKSGAEDHKCKPGSCSCPGRICKYFSETRSEESFQLLSMVPKSRSQK